MLWKQYIDTHNVEFFRKYKKIRNGIRKITGPIYKTEQNEVAKVANTNPKKFWAYVKNKTLLKNTIGDIKTYNDNKEVIISHDAEKAYVFSKYFSNVFTAEISNITVTNENTTNTNTNTNTSTGIFQTQ